MARIGYARVSTVDQDLDIQLAKLKAEGCSIIRSEKVSGGTREGRPELATVLDFLRDGDELVVARLDRLGRDTREWRLSSLGLQRKLDRTSAVQQSNDVLPAGRAEA